MKIKCEQVQFSYGDLKIFNNLNLSIQSKEHVWIRGRSGSGKSSLLKMMAGLSFASSGLVQIEDFKVTESSAAEFKNLKKLKIGYVHQENHLIDHWTVEQNLLLVTDQKQKLKSLLHKLNFPETSLNKKASEISGGEKQRISLLRMLLQNPKLALLDEPTSHLDDLNTEGLLDLIQSELKDSTLVVVSHDSRLEKLGLKQIHISEIDQ